jgi:hypothetical protein
MSATDVVAVGAGSAMVASARSRKRPTAPGARRSGRRRGANGGTV